MKTAVSSILLVSLLLLSSCTGNTRIHGIDTFDQNKRTRLVFNVSRPPEFRTYQLGPPHQLLIDLHDGALANGFEIPRLDDPVIRNIRFNHTHKGFLQIALDLKRPLYCNIYALKASVRHGHRLVVDLFKESLFHANRCMPHSIMGSHPVQIMIDPGHGNSDTGMRDRTGKLLEKNITLAIGRSLQAILNATPGIKALLTHEDHLPTKLSMSERVRIAEQHEAHMLVSLHTDSHHDRDVHGVSVYAPDPERETSPGTPVSTHGNRVGEHPAPADKTAGGPSEEEQNASVQLGETVLSFLSQVARVHNHELQTSRRPVLKSKKVPSVLVAVGHISNPMEAARLNSAAYRKELVQALGQALVEFAYLQLAPTDALIAIRRYRESNPTIYKIKPGDTLSRIAARFDLDTEVLMHYNDLGSPLIRAGDTLVIPAFLNNTVSQ